MAVPVFKKTWTVVPNDVAAASGTAATDYAALLLKLKNKFLSPGGFVVRYSCSGAVAGAAGDGVDRWATAADLVWGTGAGARSWTVLRSTAVGADFQVMIACRYAAASAPNERWIDVVVSPAAGFTGGGTTANPAAADAVVLRDGTATDLDVNGHWAGGGAASFRSAVHAWGASDATQFRAVVCTGTSGKPLAFLAFGQLANAPAGHAAPQAYACWWSASGTGTARTRYADLFSAARVWGHHGGAAYASYLGAHEVYASAALGQAQLVANDLSGRWPLTPCMLFSAAPGASALGAIGEPPDLWWGSAGLTVEGTTYDASGATRQLVQWGQLVLPWDGATAPDDGAGATATAVTGDPTLALPPSGTRYVPLADDV